MEIICCKKKCINEIPKEFVEKFKNDISGMSHSQKDICIKTMMNVCQKPSKIKDRNLFLFSIYPIGKICKIAVQWLYDVSDVRFNNIFKNNMKDIIFKNIHTNIHTNLNEKDIICEKKKDIEIICEKKKDIDVDIEIICEKKNVFNPTVVFDFDELKCPISKSLMYDPVLASDGFHYEKQSISEWLKRMNKSPMTNLKIKKWLYDNTFLKCKIKSLVEKFKNYYLNNYEFQEHELSLMIDWIISDSECDNSNSQKSSILFLVHFYDKQQNFSQAIKVLKKPGNEKELLSYMNKKNMKEEMTKFIIEEYPIMETYFSFEDK